MQTNHDHGLFWAPFAPDSYGSYQCQKIEQHGWRTFGLARHRLGQGCNYWALDIVGVTLHLLSWETARTCVPERSLPAVWKLLSWLRDVNIRRGHTVPRTFLRALWPATQVVEMHREIEWKRLWAYSQTSCATTEQCDLKLISSFVFCSLLS